MSEEISLSISETNKLRAQLGLKLIEEPESQHEPSTDIKSSSELSIVETNKLRLSLGLKPIPLQDTASSEDIESAPAIKSDSSQDKIRKRIEEAKVKAIKKRKLQRDADSVFSNEAESTDDWLNNLGKLKKTSVEQEKSKKRIKVSSNLEEDNDLDGATVDYDANELALLSNNDILTFKDTDVLEEDEIEGELSNAMLEKRRKLKYELKERENAENIKHLGRHHKQIDDNNSNSDVEDGSNGSQKVLVRNKVSGNLINVNNRKVPKATSAEEKKLQLVDLFNDIGSEVATEDYAKPKQTKMKKIKKRGPSSSRSKSIEPLDIKVVQLDQEQADEEYVDSELQELLSRKRKLKQRESRKNLTSEEMAKEISIYERLEKERELESIHTVPEGLVFDDVSEFFDKLGNATENGDEPANNGNDRADDTEAIDSEDVAKYIDITKEEKGREEGQQEEAESNDVSTINEDEESAPKFNGLGSTLKFLQSQNIVQKSTQEDQTRARELREAQREAEILKFNISVEERVLRDELAQDKQFMNTSKVEREELFQLYLDQRLREKRILPEISNASGKYSRYRQAGTTPTAVNKLKNYNPQVKLTYRDDDGNELSTKQAYKVLSHQFHGVGPSNSKSAKKNVASNSKNQIIH
ncbi:66 kDa U4/U6.U5 small nuclear ribonucleoprotein component [[Candida] railenensis]|uniref:66 kDa U4/U6.U5 small nuclear ribonucleoprotein component n=1 Tax=[Candida] railenensis TaxID=45579 RepID=A0A9P0VWS3_9ASCO|nr:66 kDa U4/U6.U5 small nuclear ribonucleoprotein component [[Candida] railenensis]